MPDPYELVATSVTSALGIRIREIFPGITWYRETVPAQLLVFPHFFVNQLTLDMQPERQNHWFVNYFATIRYREVSDPASITGSLQERLDAVGIKLMSELENIAWNDVPVTIRNPRIEKIDGVLHWFGNINVLATKPLPELIKQMKLDINTNLQKASPT